MAVSVEQLAARCGTTVARSEVELDRALALASALVTDAFAQPRKPVPDEVWDECVLRVAYSVYKKTSSQDSGTTLNADGTAVPGVANDPLRTAWPLIKRYVHRV